MTSSDTYTCELCRKTYRKAWSEAEALAEMQACFGGDTADCAVVCDDCYQTLMMSMSPPPSDA